MKNNLIRPNNIIMILTIILLGNGCKTIEECQENQILGNLGSVVNSNLEEHSPSVLVLPDAVKKKYPKTDTNDYLFFTATRYDRGATEAIYNVFLNDIQAGAELVSDTKFPLNDTTQFRNAGLPAFYYNEKTDKLEVYFAALPKFGRLSRDIYFSQKDFATEEWTKAAPLPAINTLHWESHPTISQDGKFLMFASDRPGGLGDIDIWISSRNDDGTWSEPENLGDEINTRATDYTPVFTENNDLLFATNGRGRNRRDFDLYLAKYDAAENKWKDPKMFGYPINTEFDESGATIWKNRIYLVSDRRGGCGGKDIYSFQLCGPVVLAGKVRCADPNQILSGKMILYNENKDTVGFSEVSNDGSFRIAELESNVNYTLDYKNRCYPHKRNIYDFQAPCSDSSTVMVIVSMVMPEKSAELELTEVEIPFFVTGYYKPNTEANLNALRLSFSYNLYGTNHRTRYIENPKENYDQFVSKVEAGLDDVTRYIANMLSVLDNQCLAKSEKGILLIDVKGWADPRNIASDAEYYDEDINDPVFNIRVKKGAKMTNELLSKLRAYFTAKYFETKLVREYSIGELAKSIHWKIEGMGVDKTGEVGDELKRRVTISLQYIE